jgi:hypothetical protein
MKIIPNLQPEIRKTPDSWQSPKEYNNSDSFFPVKAPRLISFKKKSTIGQCHFSNFLLAWRSWKSRSQVSGQLGHPGSEYGTGRRGGGGRGGGGRSTKKRRGGQGVFSRPPAATVVPPAATGTGRESDYGHYQRRQRKLRKPQNSATPSHYQYSGSNEHPITADQHEDERH